MLMADVSKFPCQSDTQLICLKKLKVVDALLLCIIRLDTRECNLLLTE